MRKRDKHTVTQHAASRSATSGFALALCIIAGLLGGPLGPARAVTLMAQTDQELEARITTALAAHEFKDERTSIVALGPPALPILLKLFNAQPNDERMVRIMSVLRDIQGNKQPFVPKVTDLARTGSPNVQTAALVVLGTIGSADQAAVLEGIVADPEQREAARIVGSRTLARLGTERSIQVMATTLAAERKRTGNAALVAALTKSEADLRQRLKR